MSLHRWIDKYGAVAVLLMLLLTMNPELRAFLLFANYIGVDLMIVLIAVQLRFLPPALPLFAQQLRTALCVLGFMTLRVVIRVTALLLTPSRITVGLTALLVVLSSDAWCPERYQGLRES